MPKLAILGASGHGKVIANAALLGDKWDEVAFFDDAWPEIKNNGKYAVVGDTQAMLRGHSRTEVIVAIGNNQVRLRKQMELSKLGLHIATVVHPNAIIAEDVSIGEGTAIFAGAVVNSDAFIGKAVILNTNSVVEHDCELKDGSHLSPGVCLAGGVSIGYLSWVGIGASVKQQIKIGDKVTVGAGSVVISDIPDSQTVVGVPATKILEETC